MTSPAGVRLGAAALATALALGCAGAPSPPPSPPPVAAVPWGDYEPDRRAYEAFRVHQPTVLEPNYLPFMVHRIPLEEPGGEALVFCRWSESRFPLAVHIRPPEIPDSLQDEFHPKPAEHYVTAVRVAIETWERNLEGMVRFRYVEDPEAADLRVELKGEVGPAPESDVRVLGATPLGGACRVSGWQEPGRLLHAEFEVAHFRVFVADETGLLEPDQVERLALHELGHVLGMSRHSPIPGDLMFAVARDRPLGDVLSNEDVNSFVSLYRMPSGTVFGRLGAEAEAPPPAPARPGEPVLDVAPHVDARFGYEIHPPRGWTRIETSHGVIVVDGVAWDYDASFQVIVRRYPTIESYLARYADAYLGDGTLLEDGPVEDAGRRGLRLVVRDRLPGITEHLIFLETGDGRLVVVIADCRNDEYDTYRPWFEATRGSLEVWSEPSP